MLLKICRVRAWAGRVTCMHGWKGTCVHCIGSTDRRCHARACAWHPIKCQCLRVTIVWHAIVKDETVESRRTPLTGVHPTNWRGIARGGHLNGTKGNGAL
jgi:hypothetical protein